MRVTVSIENSQGAQVVIFDEDVRDASTLDFLKEAMDSALDLERMLCAALEQWAKYAETVNPRMYKFVMER